MTSRRLIVGAATVAIMLAVQFGLYRLADRFIVDPLQDQRIPLAHNTIAAAAAFMPFGAGVGAFVPVYAMFESPQTAFVRTYANHAHNDFLEVWLETGAAGILLAGFFLLWIVRTSKIWWQAPPGAHPIDHSLARAGFIIIGLLIAHSFVDYPLRTGALEAIFAFACALLVPPPSVSVQESVRHTAPERTGNERGKSERSKPERSGLEEPASAARRSWSQAVAAAEASGDLTRRAAGRRGDDIDWGEKWRRQAAKNPPGDS